MGKYLLVLFISLSLCSCNRRRQGYEEFFYKNKIILDTFAKSVSNNFEVIDTFWSKQKLPMINLGLIENYPELESQLYPIAKLLKSKEIAELEVVDSTCLVVVLSTESVMLISTRLYVFVYSSDGKCDRRDSSYTTIEFEHKLSKNWYYREIVKGSDL